ncbi:RNA-directed DNA polymerase, eukaryota [Tanacetum coccineum]
MIYRHDFTLEHCYNILKDHKGWLEIEMPAFYNITRGRKKSKTSETTSGSAYGGFNLNNEADESEEDIQEKRAMGRDQANAKKKSCASSCEGSSLFVDLLADKFLNMKKKKWEKREEQQQSYIQLKNRELDIREAERREATELKREKLAIRSS